MGVIDGFRRALDETYKKIYNGLQILMIVAGVVLVLSGIVIVALGVTYEPTLDTQVQATIVDTEKNTEGGGSGTRERYELHVTYAYEYNGERYEAENITPLQSRLQFDSKEARREAIEEKYRVGNEVVAYIDADDPDKSGLKKAEPEENIGGGVVVVAMGLIISGWSAKKYRQ